MDEKGLVTSPVPNCEIIFLTKKEFVERKTSEFFSVEPEVEKQLVNFRDEDVLGIEVSINSPAIVKNILDGNDVVALMEKRLLGEISQDKVNESLKSLVRD